MARVTVRYGNVVGLSGPMGPSGSAICATRAVQIGPVIPMGQMNCVTDFS